jgi:TolB-like protein/class 3 adenylate cyclase/tetratricopeptide (TPR) repeat protein
MGIGMDRKLAAILAADVVGYSTLMEADEAGTHERLKAARQELFDPEIARHHGRVFKIMGDGTLAEFCSVVDAVECAVALQRGLADRNAAVPEDQRIQVRMGINLGEVIVEGDDRYGEGVNIAVRLEQLAEPGSIYVSGKVAKEVDKKLAFRFEPIGAQRLKNIAEPVTVFRVTIAGATARRPRSAIAKRSWHWTAAAAVIAILAIGWFIVRNPGEVPTPSTIPVIAVLPFDNMSGDPSFDYYGDGIAEDIITMLSRFPDLAVIARNSSFAYKGKPEDVRKIGKELGVSYVLEGSVRKDAGEVRIVAQLIDATNDKHVWADRFDESGSDPLALQDAVIEKIVVTIAGQHGQILHADYQRAWGKDTANLEEYDYALRARSYLEKDTKEGYETAAAIIREGLAKFPNSTKLKVLSGHVHFFYAFGYYSPDPEADYHEAGKLAREVLAANPLTPQTALAAHWLMAYVLLQERDFARAITEAEQAVALAPYDAGVAGNLSMVVTMSGKPDQGIEWVKKGIALDVAARPWLYYRLGLAYSLKGENEEAIGALKQSGQFVDMVLLIAISHLRLGHIDQAHAEYKRAMTIDPTFTQAKWREGYFYSDQSVVDSQIADLAKLGLPEK